MALVVVIAAVAIYLGVRAELRGEVDNSLRDRGERAHDARRRRRRPRARTRRAERGRRPARSGRRASRPSPPEPFGGPEGFAQLVLPSGSVVRPPGSRATRSRWTPRTRAIARSGSGEFLTDETVSGTHLRVLTRGSGARGDPGGAPARRGGPPAGPRAAGAAAGGRRGRGARRRPRARWWPGPRSRPIDRFTRRTEELAGDPRPLASDRRRPRRTSSAGSRAASTRRSTRSSARSRRSASWWPTRATSCARRSRACARTSRRSSTRSGCRRRSVESLRADIVAELDELTALVADIVELARGAKPGEPVDDVRLDEIVESVAAPRAGRARTASRSTCPPSPRSCAAQPDRIQRAVSNLVDNALKWSPRRRPRGDRPRGRRG